MARCLALVAIIIWFTLFSPYLTTAFIASVTAALTLPLYRWLRARMSKSASVIFFSVGMVVCVATPITIVLVMVIPQALEGAKRLGAWWQDGHPIPPAISYYMEEAHRIFVENVPNSLEYLDKLENDFNAVVNAVAKNILSSGLNLAGDTMGMVWAIFLFVVFTCLIVVYAPSIRKAVLHVLPEHEDMVERFVGVLHNASRSVFISIVFVPIIQGTLTGVGLRFLNVPDPAFWGLLAVFTAVIPLAGTALVWLPITVYLWATQSLGSALMLLAWGSIVVSGSDNLLRPYFLKTGIEVSMVVLLLSIVCSLAVFGAVGIIAGPVMVAVARQAMVESDLLSRQRNG